MKIKFRHLSQSKLLVGMRPVERVQVVASLSPVPLRIQQKSRASCSQDGGRTWEASFKLPASLLEEGKGLLEVFHLTLVSSREIARGLTREDSVSVAMVPASHGIRLLCLLFKASFPSPIPVVFNMQDLEPRSQVHRLWTNCHSPSPRIQTYFLCDFSVKYSQYQYILSVTCYYK